MKNTHGRLNGLASGSPGFDFMDDRPLHARGGDGGGGKPVAPVRLSVLGKSRVASLFDLLQELSVPPKPQSSSPGAGAGGQAPAAPGALPSPAVSSSSSKRRYCSEDAGKGQQPQQLRAQQRLSSTSEAPSEGRRRPGAAGGGGPVDKGLAPQPASISGSGQRRQQQQQQRRQESLAILRDSDSLRLPPRPVLRRVRHGHNQPGASLAEPARRVTFVEEPGEARRLKNAGGASGALRGRDRPCRVSHPAGTLGTGAGAGSSKKTGEGLTSPNAGESPARDSTTTNKLASPGTTEPEKGNPRAVSAPLVTRQPGAAAVAAAGTAAARTAAARKAAAAGSTSTTRANDLPEERPARRRRVDGGGWLGRGSGSDGSGGEGESSTSVIGPRPASSGGRQSNVGHDGQTADQVNKEVRRWMPQETDDALQWMAQGPDPTEEEAVDHQGGGGSQWSSPTTPRSLGDGGGGSCRGGGRRASNHTVLQQQQQQQLLLEEEEDKDKERGPVDGGRSDRRGEAPASPRHASPGYDECARGRRDGRGAGGEARRWSRPLSPEASPPPGRAAAAGEEAKRVAEAADDDGSSSSGDEGYTDYEGVGGRDGEEETGGASDRVQEKKKELLRVCGLCRMKGTILAMVDWSTADGGTERTIMPTSELKAEWPRKYIAYLEGKVVFAAAEDGGTAPDTGKDGDAGSVGGGGG